jgi:hypothetical protein
LAACSTWRRASRLEARAAHPHQLGCGEAGQGAIAGQPDQPLGADGLLDLIAFVRRALIVPENGRAQDAVVAVERHETVHLAAQPDPGRLAGRVAQAREDVLGGPPPVLGVAFGPAGSRGREG